MNAGEIDSVLKVDDFDVSNALEVDPKFMSWTSVLLGGCLRTDAPVLRSPAARGCVFQDENRHAATPGRHQCAR
jgi:hypothetical protein